MRPLAHHAGEESLVQLLVLSGGGLSVLLTVGRARVAAILDRFMRLLRRSQD
ncbi:MAG TPA: hypothetical protein VGC06_31215 [Actinomycetes bacterium]